MIQSLSIESMNGGGRNAAAHVVFGGMCPTGPARCSTKPTRGSATRFLLRAFLNTPRKYSERRTNEYSTFTEWFNAMCLTRQAILIAYGPDSNSANWSSIEILKTPAWIDDFYDIRARVSDTDLKAWQSQSSDHELLHSALRAALKERCNLAIHEQPSKAATFDLVIAKHGPRLKATSPEAAVPGGKKLPGGGVMLVHADSMPAKAFYGATLQDLVDFLSTVSTKIPVRDKTNLLGRYDFTLLQIPTAPNEDRVFNYPVDRLGLQIKLRTGKQVDARDRSHRKAHAKLMTIAGQAVGVRSRNLRSNCESTSNVEDRAICAARNPLC